MENMCGVEFEALWEVQRQVSGRKSKVAELRIEGGAGGEI